MGGSGEDLFGGASEGPYGCAGSANGAGGASGAGEGPYAGAFAAIYDQLITKDYSYARYARYLDAQIRRHRRAGSATQRLSPGFGSQPERPIVADLGCGSGGMCVELARLGYDMIGIDRSPAMLAIAQEKARAAGVDALFLQQDMRSFELFGTAAAIVSTIDAMNYVTSLAGLRRVFSLVANYLDPGGVFVFDVNTRHKLERVMGGEVFFDISDGRCLFWKCGFDARRAISDVSFTLFVRRPDGAYDRHDERHRQRAHAPGELAEAASAAGLEFVAEHAFMASGKPSPESGKICYVFRK